MNKMNIEPIDDFGLGDIVTLNWLPDDELIVIYKGSNFIVVASEEYPEETCFCVERVPGTEAVSGITKTGHRISTEEATLMYRRLHTKRNLPNAIMSQSEIMHKIQVKNRRPEAARVRRKTEILPGYIV